MQDSKANDHTAAEAAGAGDVAGDFPREIESRGACGGKKFPGSGIDHGIRRELFPAPNDYVIVALQRDTEAVEARAEVGAGGGNAHRDLVIHGPALWRKCGEDAIGGIAGFGRVCLQKWLAGGVK